MTGGRLGRALGRPWIAYLAIALLQLKVMWGAWLYRDLTSGDTIAYYLYATWWAQGFQVNLVWSPLYTAFYGTVLAAFPDAYTATILHRLLIAVAASLLVLALSRRLLPAWIAWLAVHLLFLVGFRNKFSVLMQWIYSYLTYKRGARIITGVSGEKSAGSA